MGMKRGRRRGSRRGGDIMGREGEKMHGIQADGTEVEGDVSRMSIESNIVHYSLIRLFCYQSESFTDRRTNGRTDGGSGGEEEEEDRKERSKGERKRE